MEDLKLCSSLLLRRLLPAARSRACCYRMYTIHRSSLSALIITEEVPALHHCAPRTQPDCRAREVGSLSPLLRVRWKACSGERGGRTWLGTDHVCSAVCWGTACAQPRRSWAGLGEDARGRGCRGSQLCCWEPLETSPHPGAFCLTRRVLLCGVDPAVCYIFRVYLVVTSVCCHLVLRGGGHLRVPCVGEGKRLMENSGSMSCL